jgi:hypothetical protein
MNRQGVVSVGIVLALSTGARAFAQEQHPNGFYLTAPMSISSGFDQDFVVSAQRLSDTVTLLTGPAFTWLRTTHRSQLNIEYQPEVELFARNPGLDASNNSATMRFMYRINSRWSMDAGDYFLSTMDPSRALVNSLLLLPRGRFLQNDFYSTLAYRIDQATKVSFRFDNAVTTMDLTGPFSGRLNVVTTAETVTLDRELTSRQKLMASYSFLHGTPLNPESGGSPSNAHLLNLGYTYEVNPGLLIRLAAGEVEGTQAAFTGAAAVEKRFGDFWLAAGYQRYLAFFGGLASLGATPPTDVPVGNGLAPSTVYQVASVHGWGKLTRRIGIDANGQRGMNGLDRNFRSIRSLIGQIRVDYKINERLTFFVRAEHYGQNINPFFDTVLSRNRYFGGFEIALSRPPEQENARNKHGKHPEESNEPRTGEPRIPEDQLR